jgi:hypothetical protein
MGKIKDEVQLLFDTCERLYQIGGASAVIDYIEESMRQGQDMIILDVVYEHCKACDAEMPSLNHTCLVCGQTTSPTKQQLVNAVIEDLKKGFELGDYTVLDELLNKLSIKTLVQSLPEEDWDEYTELNNSYFEIMQQDFCEDSRREEIQIHAGENGNIFIFQDDGKLGLIIDVYGQNDHYGTLIALDEDLNPLDEDELLEESNAPENFSEVEVHEFDDNWGQTNDEICAELGYDDDGSDEMIMGDGYVWVEHFQKWFPKTSSMYSEREQAIMDYILVTYC